MVVSVSDLQKVFVCQGRRYVQNGRLFLNASGASLKGAFQGSVLRLFVYSDAVSKDRPAYIRLTLDGATRRILLKEGERVLTKRLTQGEHTFEVIKLTESANNSFGVMKVETDGAFLPLKDDSSLNIEFIGDSITTGFGVLAPINSYGEYKTKEQDVTKAFSYLTAKALNANYSVIAAGGWGVCKSKYSPYAIPDYYDHVDLLRNTEKYDDPNFCPDVFVVALGTNDESYLADLSEPVKGMERAVIRGAFVAFIKKLLAKNKPVVLVYGFFDYPDLKTLTEEVWQEVDSPFLSTLEVKSDVSLNDVRAGHPGKRCHKLAAQRLVKALRTLL